jgi:hypothetical protein
VFKPSRIARSNTTAAVTGLAVAWGGTAPLVSPLARDLDDPSRLRLALVGQALFWALAVAVVASLLFWEKQPLRSLARPANSPNTIQVKPLGFQRNLEFASHRPNSARPGAHIAPKRSCLALAGTRGRGHAGHTVTILSLPLIINPPETHRSPPHGATIEPSGGGSATPAGSLTPSSLLRLSTRAVARNMKQPARRQSGRNARCWCGSGKKYKHCHLKMDEAAESARYAPDLPRPRDYGELLHSVLQPRQIRSDEVDPRRQ